MPNLKVRKPTAILFDINGTATKTYFTDKVLYPYIRTNCKVFLENNWSNQVVQRDVEALRAESRVDAGPAIVDDTESQDVIIQSVSTYVCTCLDEVRINKPVSTFQFHILFDGYKKNKLETPVYSDVAIQIRHWALDLGIKLYVLSNAWAEATKRFMAKTSQGDLNLLIEGHFDTSEGNLDDPATYQRIVAKLGLPQEEILFLTKSGVEARAAKQAGIGVILVQTHRKQLERRVEADKQLLYIRTFNELTFASDGPYASQMSPTFSTASGHSGGGGNGANDHHSSAPSSTSTSSSVNRNSNAPPSSSSSSSSSNTSYTSSRQSLSSNTSSSRGSSSSSSSSSNTSRTSVSRNSSKSSGSGYSTASSRKR